MRKSLIVAAALLCASPAVSHAKTLEELLVEKGVITKAEAKGAATSSAASKVYWNNGTRFEFPDNGFTTSFATHLEERYQFIDNPEEVGGKNVSDFEFTKARIIISGTALHNEFSYYLMPDFVGSSSSTGSRGTNLQDAWIAWHACDWADIKMGQFKTFISRQFQTADWKRQFPNNSVASDYFSFGRQQGLATEMRFADNQVVLNAGVWNGTSNYGTDGGIEGINNPGRDTKHSGAVSVRWNAMGEIDAFEEGDVNWTDDLALSFGAAYGIDDSAFSGKGVEPRRDLHAISADANMKWRGLSVHGEFFDDVIDPEKSDDDINPLGFYLQAGYFVMPKKLEVGARYGYIECDNGTSPGLCSGLDSFNEAAAVVNYYWWKHNLKASLSYEYYNYSPEAKNADDYNQNAWIFQLSSFF